MTAPPGYRLRPRHLLVTVLVLLISGLAIAAALNASFVSPVVRLFDWVAGDAKVGFGTGLLGCVSGVVGAYAVLRRRALLGDMLSHAALPGLCLALIVVGSRNSLALVAGAFVAGLIGIGVVYVVTRWTRTKEDAAIGIVLSTFFGLGIVLLSVLRRLPVTGKSGIQSYLFGQAALLRNVDILLISVSAVACLLLVLLFYKELKVFSFDPEYATAQGWPSFCLDIVITGALAVVTIVGLPAVGVVLMAGMVIIPGATARFWTDRLHVLLLLAALFGATMGIAGTSLSARVSNLPTGPTMVLCGTAVFLASMLFAPKRGVVARAVRESRARRKRARENLLRALYEINESRLPELIEIGMDELRAQRAWHGPALGRLVVHAASRDLIEYGNKRVRLTEKGLKAAESITRAHRLWELYLIERANIAYDHVDRDADSLEHYLEPEILDRLEQRLAAAGRLPGDSKRPPHSPHEIPTGEIAEGQTHG